MATSWKRAGNRPWPPTRGHRDDSVLERLTQRLQRGPRELRKLVEKQDAAVREAGFPGARARAATDDRRGRRTVVRRSKRRHRQERALGPQETGHRMDPGDLERLRSRERRQDPGNRRASIVFPVPGGPARRRLCLLQRRSRARGALAPVRGRRPGRGGRAAAVHPARRWAGCPARRAGMRPLRPGGRPGSPRPLPAQPPPPTRGADHPCLAVSARPVGDRDRTRNRPDATVQPEFAE